jgi:hypothetical protein
MSLLHPTNYGLGEIVFVNPGAVAVGANPTVTVPVGELWRLRAWAGTLVTSGVAGGRQPFIRAQSAGVVTYARSAQSFIAAAGVVGIYTWSLGLSNPATSPNPGQAGLWDLLLPAGHSFVITAIAFDPGDQWIATAYVYERWFLTD